MDSIHAAVPHSLLQAVRQLDHRPDTDLDDEMSAKKFGSSKTVVAQIHRYAALSASGTPVPVADVAGLLTLVTRRLDADLVVKTAGQLAAESAIVRVRASLGLNGILPGPARTRLERRAARRILRELVGSQLAFDGSDFQIGAIGPGIGDGLQRVKCDYDGAVMGEVLQALCGFRGALRHEECRAQGAEACVWRPIKSERI